jgi:hypothetical protein
LHQVAFDELVDLLEELLGWDNPTGGRPKSLPLREAVKLMLLYFKTNITQEVLGDVFEVSQPTVSRIIAALEGPVTDVTCWAVPPLADAQRVGTVLIDGSLLRCWSWSSAPKLWSGKHATTGHTVLFLTDLDGNVLAILGPFPGSVHDSKALALARDVYGKDFPPDLLGDKGFIGTGVITPYRKPPEGELVKWQHEFNTQIASIRQPVERAIANFKIWRSMHTDYRRPLHTITTAFNLIRSLYFYNTAYE